MEATKRAAAREVSLGWSLHEVGVHFCSVFALTVALFLLAVVSHPIFDQVGVHRLARGRATVQHNQS